MNGLSLFSGIGGLDVALSPWVKPITYCEIDPFCQGVLLSRMADESLCHGPLWDDITTLDGNIFRGAIDIIYGGFPCQDISIAGHGKGLEGERSRLFFEIMRMAKESESNFIFLENVPAITTRGGLQVVKTITDMGYDCRWCIISAASVGALHQRERWFLLAKLSGSRNNSSDGHADSKPSKQTDTETKPIPTIKAAWRGSPGQHWPFGSPKHWQETVSKMGKSSDGIPYHVDRIKALGNSVVPQQAKEAFKILMGIEKQKD